MSKTKQAGFIMVPNRLLEMNLDSYEIAVFNVIKRNNPSHPGYKHFKNKIGISRDRLWKALNTLKQCNIINWDRGNTGKSNIYIIMPEGVWVKKNPYATRTTTHPSSVLPPVRQAYSNKTNSIRLNNKREERDINILVKSLIKKI